MKKNNKQEIRVRLAPSPTGPLHLGTARTALFNYLFAKKYQGKFILRIEDTDKERSKPEFEKNILESLLWLGLKWDEGPTGVVSGSQQPALSKLASSSQQPALSKLASSSQQPALLRKEGIDSQSPVPDSRYLGNYGPYRQSERGEIYASYIKKLLQSGQAFWCYHTKEELKKEKEEQMKRKEPPRHICNHKNCRIKRDKSKGIIRFSSPAKKIIINDLIRGKVEFDTSLLGDFSIARDEKTPLYNLAVVIDDYKMKISHIIRGEDHLPNTPKQILLQEALGLPSVQYAHLPLILGPDKSKLSKRHGAVSLTWYKEEGYLPEAMINFLALLGWHPLDDQKEIFSLEEAIQEFSLERVQKSPAIFNLEKLDWLNGWYIRHLPLEELTKRCLPYLEKAGLIEKVIN